MTVEEALYVWTFMLMWLFLPLCIGAGIGQYFDNRRENKIDATDFMTRLERGEELVGGVDGNIFHKG